MSSKAAVDYGCFFYCNIAGMRQLTIEGLRKDLDLDFSARCRSVEMTSGSLGRNDRREVRLVVLGWGHRERKGRESASGGAV